MNYGNQNWNRVTSRTSSMAGVLGFIIPPGSNAIYTPNMLASTGASTASGAPITTWTIPLFGTINLDPVVGGLAMAAGGLILTVGLLSLLAMVIARTRVGRAAGNVAATASGPAGMAVSKLHASAARPAPAPKPKPTVDVTAAQNEQASQQRVAKAYARVTTSSDEERFAVERQTLQREQTATGTKPKPGAAIRSGELA
jgi:hypothetical protein